MTSKTSFIRSLPSYAALGLLIYMPFHVFLSQWLSTFTGGLEYWKLAKDLFLALAYLITLGLVIYYKVYNRVFWIIVGFNLVYAALHFILWAAHPDIYNRSALLGTTYNVRLPLLLGLGYGASLLRPSLLISLAPRVVVIVGTMVSALGVVQYFLPADFMTHFGYSLSRGVMPAFFVDGKPDLPLRVMSTLREPNALGAYLLVPILMTVFMAWRARSNKRLILAGCLSLQVLALFLTLSRSAWLAVFVSVLILAAHIERQLVKKYWKLIVGLMFVGAACLVVLLIPMSDTHFVQRYITHSGQAEVDDPNSNGYHWIFIRRGLAGIAAQPLGHGPGTAGLASIQNPSGSFLTENYYIQIGYELGVLGLGLFIALHIWLYRLLRRSSVWWAPVILASFWAYIITNMLLHTWSNEAAVMWWLVVGVAAISKKAI